MSLKSWGTKCGSYENGISPEQWPVSPPDSSWLSNYSLLLFASLGWKGQDMTVLSEKEFRERVALSISHSPLVTLMNNNVLFNLQPLYIYIHTIFQLAPKDKTIQQNQIKIAIIFSRITLICAPVTWMCFQLKMRCRLFQRGTASKTLANPCSKTACYK